MPSSIILDCDPGEDDALAILYALQKGLPVKVLVCGFGNTSSVNTIRNGAGLLSLAGRPDIPLYRGAEKPFKPHPIEHDLVDAGAFVGSNGMCGVELPSGHGIQVVNSQATEVERLNLLAKNVRDMGPVTYIVSGPCSTLAHLIHILGDEAGKTIMKIIVMGGALDAGGNHGPANPDTGKPYAEFNFYCDPHGTDALLRSGIPVTIVPWDLTVNIVLNYNELKEMKGKGEIAGFVLTLIRNFLESFGIANQRAFEFNDCINLIAYEGKGIETMEKLRIVLEGEQAGRLVRDNVNGTLAGFFRLEKDEIIPVRNAILDTLGVRPAI